MALPQIKSGTVKQISINHLLADPDQIRQTFDKEKLQALADDIAIRGIEQPITVRKNGDDGYVVKHGERRRRAAIMAGLDKVPVILAKAERGEDAPLNRLFDQYAENMMREDLNAMDMAFFCKRLRDEFEYKVSEIPSLFVEKGLKKYASKTISNLIRLTDLPEWARDYIQHDKLTASHGIYLLKAMESEKVLSGVEKELKKELEGEEKISVRDLRRKVWSHYEDNYPDLSDTDDFQKQYNTDTAVFYAYKKLDKDEQKELKIVHVPTHNDGDTRPFALNLEAHERINNPLREKWIAKQNKKTESTATTPEKESRTGPSEQRLQDYLHNWLTEWIVDKLGTLESDDLCDLHRRICLWLAYNSPCYINDIGDDAWVSHDEPVKGQDNATIEMALGNLNYFLNHGQTNEEIRRNLVDSTLPHISFSNACILANHLGIDIDKDYSINLEYLSMYTKAGLIQLASSSDIEVEQQKVADIRKHLLEGPYYEGEELRSKQSNKEKIGVPNDIKELYEATLDEALAE